MDIPTTTISAAPTTAPEDQITLSYGASLAEDAAAFESSLETAQARLDARAGEVSELAKAAIKPLEYIDQEALSLSDYANTALASDNELTPAEIVNLTVQSQKFMFHSQLTANVANRSADGIQQLFRQQG